MKRDGFTLLEVLVATAIMGAAVVALLANLSTSMNNASRVDAYERARLLARRTMDALLADPRLPKMTPIEGNWDEQELGFPGGWRARVVPFERAPGAGPGSLALDRIELEVWWEERDQRKSLRLEAYRVVALTAEDLKLEVPVSPATTP